MPLIENSPLSVFSMGNTILSSLRRPTCLASCKNCNRHRTGQDMQDRTGQGNVSSVVRTHISDSSSNLSSSSSSTSPPYVRDVAANHTWTCASSSFFLSTPPRASSTIVFASCRSMSSLSTLPETTCRFASSVRSFCSSRRSSASAAAMSALSCRHRAEQTGETGEEVRRGFGHHFFICNYASKYVM
jgi:hypothetical protein